MKAKDKKTVFVALSGGVDSSVAALLLKKQGYYVVGVFMRCWKDGIATPVNKSCMQKDAEDARKVAEKLEIPFYVWDFEKEYKKKVVDYMVDGYKKGITPNPDVMCNKEIKFGLFLEKALKMGADYVATGHYVKLGIRNRELVTRGDSLVPSYYLLVARDLNKDQSYFLWTLTQEQLRYCLFPIGDYLKSEVRKIAKRAGLPTADKKDSQGICFLGKVALDEFLGKYISEKRGEVWDVRGEKIGEHKGVYFYTIGQRHIGIMNQELRIKNKHESKPLYVVEKDIKTNTLIVAEGSDDPALYKNKINITNVSFINQRPMTDNSQQIFTRIRYRQPLAKAKLVCHWSSVVSCELIFEYPQKFVAPGQSAVFYLPAKASAKAGNEMLGGGIIL